MRGQKELYNLFERLGIQFEYHEHPTCDLKNTSVLNRVLSRHSDLLMTWRNMFIFLLMISLMNPIGSFFILMLILPHLLFQSLIF